MAPQKHETRTTFFSPTDSLTTRFCLPVEGYSLARRLGSGPPGYDAAKREPIYRQMFESKNPRRVFELLKENQHRIRRI